MEQHEVSSQPHFQLLRKKDLKLRMPFTNQSLCQTLKPAVMDDIIKQQRVKWRRALSSQHYEGAQCPQLLQALHAGHRDLFRSHKRICNLEGRVTIPSCQEEG
jgi:hypothetical protein